MNKKSLFPSIVELSETQYKVLLHLSNFSEEQQLAGYRKAKYLSAAHALVRKGLAATFRTGHFKLTERGHQLATYLKSNELSAKTDSIVR